MDYKIEKAAVIGAGVMGSGIAAHLANAGIPVYLLDIVLPLSDAERQKGVKEDSKAFRNKLSIAGKEKATKSRPAALFSVKDADLLTCGNIEDDLNVISEVDWVIEVVMENMAIKKDLYKRIQAHWKEGIIVSSNTSGLSINKMIRDCSDELKSHFLGTHFFNPVRYMKLLEIIPGRKTKKDIVKFITEFGERRLGKGIVFAKDTPNFIANRIGIYGMMLTIKTMIDMGMSIEEVDAIFGDPMGRPKSAVFRTADIVGLDTLMHVAKNVYENLPSDSEKDIFKIPSFMEKMIEKGLLGDKSKSGFYKVEKGGEGKTILSIDYNTLEYKPQVKPDIPSLKAAKGVSNVAQRVKSVVYAQDKAGEFAWKIISKSLLYAAKRIPEIADDVVNIDNGMKWGYNWQLGPFEIWDAIGVKESVERMEKDENEIPENVRKVLASDGCFYKKEQTTKSFFDIKTAKYKDIKDNPKIINLNILKEKEKVVAKNAGASVIDLGDGVACLQFHSALQPEMNPIDDDTIAMMNKSIEVVKKDFLGLVIANHGANFCVGANLMLILMNANQSKWDLLEKVVSDFQMANQSLKLASFPVVAAPHQMALGGGCEICLHADRIRASAETYIGLVEVGVGLIPAGGGCKELLVRCLEGIPDGVDVANTTPFVGKAFMNIATAKVATSAKEGIDLSILRKTDKFSINSDHRIYDAKQTVIAMVKEGYETPRERKDLKVPGRDGYAALSNMAWVMNQGGYATEYDLYLAKKVAYILTGGDVTTGTLVSEQHILDLEREVFIHLCGQEKTKARMQSMLMNKKPLRN